jgi:hypothetical protein
VCGEKTRVGRVYLEELADEWSTEILLDFPVNSADFRRGLAFADDVESVSLLPGHILLRCDAAVGKMSP